MIATLPRRRHIKELEGDVSIFSQRFWPPISIARNNLPVVKLLVSTVLRRRYKCRVPRFFSKMQM